MNSCPASLPTSGGSVVVETSSGPALECPSLSTFDPSSWESLGNAFLEAPRIDFRQSWKEGATENEFRPGSVRIGWIEDRFCYFADLTDDTLTSAATGRNDLLWTLGDVIEFFAGAERDPAYIEYHTAPNGCILQLRWPDADALAGANSTGDLGPFFVIDDRAVTRVRSTPGGWQVYGEVPAASVSGASKLLSGQVWRINFGRYDYSPGRDPVLSATAPLSQLSYHRRTEWDRIVFQ